MLILFSIAAGGILFFIYFLAVEIRKTVISTRFERQNFYGELHRRRAFRAAGRSFDKLNKAESRSRSRLFLELLTVPFYILTVLGLLAVMAILLFSKESICGILALTCFFLSLAVMFHVLALSPRRQPWIFGKEGGLKKSLFVCISLFFALIFIVLTALSPTPA